MELNFKFIKKVADWVFEIIYPSKCFGCKKQGEILCFDCIRNLRRDEKLTEQNILACFDYQEPLIKDLIWKLKYHNKLSLGKKLGEILYGEFIEDLSDLRIYSSGQPVIIIPVPISKKREKTRGYNQAEKLARGFCQADEGGNFTIYNKIIYKKNETTPQAKITNRNKRLKNIKNSFGIKNEGPVKNRTIIIVDDVTTTGGTISEIKNLLEKSGAKKVIGMALAH